LVSRNDVIDAVLLWFGGDHWDRRFVGDWKVLTELDDATQKDLCDWLRKARDAS
jgi:hypothetical protein